MTHAFFKALLFLAAGSVIIGMHHEQDMRRMGGLREVHADHVLDLPDRLARADRLPGLVGFLLEGHHHRGRCSESTTDGRQLRVLVRVDRRVRARRSTASGSSS